LPSFTASGAGAGTWGPFNAVVLDCEWLWKKNEKDQLMYPGWIRGNFDLVRSTASKKKT